MPPLTGVLVVPAGLEPGHAAAAQDADGPHGRRARPGRVQRQAVLGLLRRQRQGTAPHRPPTTPCHPLTTAQRREFEAVLSVWGGGRMDPKLWAFGCECRPLA